MSRKDATRAPKKLIPAGLPPELVSTGEEADRLHESALYSGQGQFEQMKLWRTMNLVLGVPAAVLAAVAGGTGLAAKGHTLVPGILALIAAGFGAALTTLNPSRRVTQSQTAANAYLELQTAIRQFLLIDLGTSKVPDARDRLSELTALRDEVNKQADPPGWYARSRANRSILSGGQTYEIDTKRD